MEIFYGDKGVALTPEEFREIVEMDLLQELIDSILDLQGELYLAVEQGQEGMVQDVLDQLMEADVESLLEDEEINEEDLRAISVLRRLGFQ